ncbi:MAG: Hsp20/alpha crystallin family protein, partial [Acidobacteria bacterium]|nr:Hsp20/alpha crystallin family protein [Acidobacteriota bacterium]
MAWDPMRDLRVWHERLERLTDHRPDSWTPPIDVYETQDRYVVAAEVPGLAREHIDLAVEDSRLTI